MPHAAWDLRPDVIYLNHGSFGPSPRVVIEERCRWYRELEAEPMDFFTRRLEAALAEARAALAKFVGTSGDNLIFVDNATWAMNVVAESCDLQPGDEVLLNDHEYGAVHRIWERRCRERGAKLVVAKIPTPLRTVEDVIEPLFAAITPRTKLLVFSHVTSPTAIIFPAAEICRRARERGVMTCIDGPHALVMTDVQLDQLDCDYYCASNHKWLCAPFGSGFLYVHPRHQSGVQPVVTSWGRSYPPDLAPAWHNEFTWGGTRDCSAYLATPKAIEFIESVGVATFREHAHRLARQAREQITQLTGREALVPDDPTWYGSMISLPIPPGMLWNCTKRFGTGIASKCRSSIGVVSGWFAPRPTCILARLISNGSSQRYRRSFNPRESRHAPALLGIDHVATERTKRRHACQDARGSSSPGEIALAARGSRSVRGSLGDLHRWRLPEREV